jgi:histidinol dehydrogenase
MNAGREHITRLRNSAERVNPAAQAKLREVFGESLSPGGAVARIIADVRSRGDAALREWSRNLDGMTRTDLSVGQDEIDAAFAETPLAVREALALSADRIRAFHEKTKPRGWLEWSSDGEALGQIIQPLARAGIYVPGGSAPLPSSLLMSAIPAQVAGVREIIVATPPAREGHVAPVILAAAKVAGMTRVYAVGGAQAIAALAYGTESIPRVDKIFGAGGEFTTLAKQQVFGQVGIDGLNGPTETLLIADDSATPAYLAADLLAQAEHDPLATSLLITTSPALADAVRVEIERQLPGLARGEIIRQSIAAQGALIVVADSAQAIELANLFAPEHLCLAVREAWELVPQIRNAGGIFVGERSSEALGDYVLGPSHVMPTRGTARFASPLNVNDFVKITSVFYVSEPGEGNLSQAARVLAESEGLTAHANALAVRQGGNQ